MHGWGATAILPIMNETVQMPKCFKCSVRHGTLRGGRVVLLRLVPVEGYTTPQWACVDCKPKEML